LKYWYEWFREFIFSWSNRLCKNWRVKSKLNFLTINWTWKRTSPTCLKNKIRSFLLSGPNHTFTIDLCHVHVLPCYVLLRLFNLFYLCWAITYYLILPLNYICENCVATLPGWLCSTGDCRCSRTQTSTLNSGPFGG